MSGWAVEKRGGRVAGWLGGVVSLVTWLTKVLTHHLGGRLARVLFPHVSHIPHILQLPWTLQESLSLISQRSKLPHTDLPPVGSRNVPYTVVTAAAPPLVFPAMVINL